LLDRLGSLATGEDIAELLIDARLNGAEQEALRNALATNR